MYVLVDGDGSSPVDGVTVVASLVGSEAPAPVRVVIRGLPYAASIRVSAVVEGAAPRLVPGGVLSLMGAPGGQVSLVDNRTPFNTPVRYEVAVEGGNTYASTTVTVPYPFSVLQSLDGRTVVDVKWMNNGLPREPVIRSSAYEVPGRRRPPVRFAAGGDGGGELVLRTDAANSARLNHLLMTGRPLVVRTAKPIEDFPPVELILPRSAPSQALQMLTPGSRRMGPGREWSLSYLLVDDPEPSTPLSVFSWDDVEAALLGRSWDEVEAMFTPTTWDSYELTDWGQYS